MLNRGALRAIASGPRADLLLAAGLTVACMGVLFAEQNADLLDVITVLLAGATLAFRRARPVQAVGALVALFALNAVAAHVPPVPSILPLAMVTYSCGAYAPRQTGLLALGLLAVTMQIATGFKDFPNVEIAFTTLGPWWAGWEVQQRRQLVHELAARTRELEDQQEAFARLAVRRERARIARELHDIVTHHLAVMVIQAGAGRLADPADAGKARERLATIGDAGRQAVEDMERLLELLDANAGEEADGRGRLARLLEQAQAGPSQVAVELLPAGTELPAALEEAALRVVQEGLTNAMKHATGAEVRVRLVLENDLLIEVRNGSSTEHEPALAATGSGLGLSGMRERVRTLGGTMSAGPEEGGGWCLRVRVPA